MSVPENEQGGDKSTPEIIIPPHGIKLDETEFDGMSFVCPTPDEMDRLNFYLARRILTSEMQFDRVISLARGALTYTRDVMDVANIPEVSTTRIRVMKDVDKVGEEAVIEQPISDKIDGQRVIILDEVTDRGLTLRKAISYVEVMGAIEVATAALFYKPQSSVKPDFYAYETDKWVVFPHSKREFIDSMTRTWTDPKRSGGGLSPDQIFERLVKIGLDENQASQIQIDLQRE